MSDAWSAILDRVVTTRAQGQLPVVICDIDSTLFSTGRRHLRILQEFASKQRDEALSVLVQTLGPRDFGWSVFDPLDRAQVGDAPLRRALRRAWSSAFFSARLSDIDDPHVGASAFCERLCAEGALIVYLTGRDARVMGEGTARMLIRHCFPLLQGDGLLWLKSDPGAGDTDHKKRSLVRIAQLGRVVGSLENEPAYCNAYADAFSDAVHVCFGAIHSPDAPPLHAGIWREAAFP